MRIGEITVTNTSNGVLLKVNSKALQIRGASRQFIQARLDELSNEVQDVVPKQLLFEDILDYIKVRLHRENERISLINRIQMRADNLQELRTLCNKYKISFNSNTIEYFLEGIRRFHTEDTVYRKGYENAKMKYDIDNEFSEYLGGILHNVRQEDLWQLECVLSYLNDGKIKAVSQILKDIKDLRLYGIAYEVVFLGIADYYNKDKVLTVTIDEMYLESLIQETS